jgi:hypothetical protein
MRGEGEGRHMGGKGPHAKKSKGQSKHGKGGGGVSCESRRGGEEGGTSKGWRGWERGDGMARIFPWIRRRDKGVGEIKATKHKRRFDW